MLRAMARPAARLGERFATPAGARFAAAVLSALSSAALAACGGGAPAPADPARLLERSLTERGLSVRWVACSPAAERVEAVRVHRCNVSFGDPHVQIYCAAIVEGELRRAEWRPAGRGAQDRAASARECAGRLRGAG